MTTSEIAQLDTRWSRNKIKTLVLGDATVTITDATGQTYTEERKGRTAYDLRCSALDNGRIEDIIEPMQLDIAIEAIEKWDSEASLAVHLTTRGWTEDEIDDLMAAVTGRPAYQLVNRGIDLIVRYEGGRSFERAGSRVGSAVCWRCMERAAKPGELCADDCDGLTDRKRRQLAGLLRGPKVPPYDPTERPAVDTMSDDQRLSEINLLAVTQGVSVEDARGVDRRRRDAPIAGGTEYDRNVVPYGTSPDEITGVDWSPLA